VCFCTTSSGRRMPSVLKSGWRYLAIANKRNIKTIFVFFDDCWNESYSAGHSRAQTRYTQFRMGKGSGKIVI
jgi:hypothetical protein